MEDQATSVGGLRPMPRLSFQVGFRAGGKAQSHAITLSRPPTSQTSIFVSFQAMPLFSNFLLTSLASGSWFLLSVHQQPSLLSAVLETTMLRVNYPRR